MCCVSWSGHFVCGVISLWANNIWLSLTRARVSVTGVPSIGAWLVVTSRRDGHRTSGAPGLRVLGPDPRDTPLPPDMGRVWKQQQVGEGRVGTQAGEGRGPRGQSGKWGDHWASHRQREAPGHSSRDCRARGRWWGHFHREKWREYYIKWQNCTICIHEIFLTKHWYFISYFQAKF